MGMGMGMGMDTGTGMNMGMAVITNYIATCCAAHLTSALTDALAEWQTHQYLVQGLLCVSEYRDQCDMRSACWTTYHELNCINQNLKETEDMWP